MPGRPNTGTGRSGPLSRPNANGLAGLDGDLHPAHGRPSRPSTALTMSKSPMLTPPDVTTASHRTAASARTASRAASSSRTRPRSIGVQPAWPTRAEEHRPVALPDLTGRRAARRPRPARPPSTARRREVGRRPAPTPGPRWPGRRRRPGAARCRRGTGGRPCGRRRPPAAPRRPSTAGRSIRTRRPSSVTSVSSTITTASAPGGSGAPVMIRMAPPGSTGPVGAAPAAIVPSTRSSTGDGRGVGGADGEAVDGRVVEGRDLLGRVHVLGRHVAERVAQADRHHRQRRAGRQDLPPGVVEGDHLAEGNAGDRGSVPSAASRATGTAGGSARVGGAWPSSPPGAQPMPSRRTISARTSRKPLPSSSCCSATSTVARSQSSLLPVSKRPPSKTSPWNGLDLAEAEHGVGQLQLPAGAGLERGDPVEHGRREHVAAHDGQVARRVGGGRLLDHAGDGDVALGGGRAGRLDHAVRADLVGSERFSAMTDPPVRSQAVIMSARSVDPSAIRSSGRSTANGSSPTW